MFDLLFAAPPTGTYVEIWQPDNGRRFVEPDKIANITLDLEVDTYFGVALRSNRGSEIADVYGTKAFWVDFDKDDAPAPRATFPPSIIVASGSPGHFHYYWLLDRYCSDPEAIVKANKALIDDIEGDGGCHNVNRLLRVPGSRNSKTGERCELRQVRGFKYSVGDFEVLSRLDSKTRHKIRTGDSRGYRGDRSRRDWDVITTLISCGGSFELCKFLFETTPIGDKYRDPKTNGEEYLNHTWEKAIASPAVAIKSGYSGNIFAGPDGYYVESSKGRKRVSTFLLQPKLLLLGDTQDAIVADVSAGEYTWRDVTFRRDAFNNRQSLDKELRIAAWSWLGRDDDVRQLLPYLLRQLQEADLPKTRATSVLGRHGKYFVGTQQTLSAEEIYDGTNGPLVYLSPAKERPEVELSVRDWPKEVALVEQINTPQAIWPILGWYMATPYKPLIEGMGVRFPILNVHGTRGSGKTSLLRFLQSLVGYVEPKAYDCRTTRFVTLTLLGSSNAIPISFSEYRVDIAEQINRFILLAYDTGHDPRGRGDQTTVDYPLLAPFTVDGEDVVNDAACRERIVGVLLHPDDIAEGTEYYNNFNILRQINVKGFAGNYLQHTLRTDVGDLLASSRRLVWESFTEQLPDRVRNNLIVVTMGISSWCAFTGRQIPNLSEILRGALESVWSSKLGRGATLADEFIQTIVNQAAKGRDDFKCHTETGEFWFQLAPAFDWWLRNRRGSGQTSLNREAIRIQLMERLKARGGPGQYTIEPKAINGVWMYGVDLPAAVESGLDIPDNISYNGSITVKF